jgi:hypothetical protein
MTLTPREPPHLRNIAADGEPIATGDVKNPTVGGDAGGITEHNSRRNRLGCLSLVHVLARDVTAAKIERAAAARGNRKSSRRADDEIVDVTITVQRQRRSRAKRVPNGDRFGAVKGRERVRAALISSRAPARIRAAAVPS